MAQGDFLGTYDATKVTLLFGAYAVTGLGEGTFIKAARMTPDLYKLHVGAHGEVSRTKNPDISGIFTFLTKMAGPQNVVLSGMKNSPTLFPVLLKNASSGLYIATSSAAWIAKNPEVNFDFEEKMLEWVVQAADFTDSFIGS